MLINRFLGYILAFTALSFATVSSDAQTRKFRLIGDEWVEVVESETDSVTPQAEIIEAPVENILPDTLNVIPEVPVEPVDTIVMLVPDTTLDVSGRVFPPYYYTPMVFDHYDINVGDDHISNNPEAYNPEDPTTWVNDMVTVSDRFRRFKQRYMVNNPTIVRYNVNTLPEAPKMYRAFVDPTKASITVEELVINQKEVKENVKAIEVKKKYWLNQFKGLVQFSQAYNSPNWYQGGNNNVNTIINAIYNFKLNPAFHPNILFDNTIQYKLAMNSAPDDTLRSYSISEDLLQINSKFGIKAAKRWYYSATLQFKTQLFNHYPTNSDNLKAAFLAPGELNLGLGMTYEYVSPSKNFNFNVSVAPLSYNLKICKNDRIPVTNFGIKEGHTSVSQYGSNIDCKMTWKMAYNISLVSRLTAFTNYDYIQGDWENTLSFNINRYLSTQLYVHLRYDSLTRRYEDTKWHKWQLKEILSFGFSYTFGTV